ncbi:DegT/DnrJ/EryC1/StrS family aminotransferase [bacterium]|nr:DegT/DnrJ/EryC1/StrS family aminotransferase [bacterium]MBU1615434.1 DegT/DnrJ/EryC1/StrS family aminotransferase [bacterium]
MGISLLDLKAQYREIKPEIDEAVLNCLSSGHFILGENVSLLEEEVAAYCEAKYGIGVASGTDALLLALMAYGIGPQDEVITSPFTFIATAEVITLLGAKPVFVDIDQQTFNLSPDLIKEAITPRTKAIIPVHLYGQAADLDPILNLARNHNLKMIEDGAQAIGARYKGRRIGGIGDVGALSFFPAKNLGGYGDGGMVLTNDEEIAGKIKKLRVHGSSKKYHHSLIGINGRLDELQAAILRVKLKRLEEWTKARQRNASYYNQLLEDSPVTTPRVLPFNEHVYNQYTIRANDRDRLQEYLKERGIDSAIHYPIPLHLQEAFAYLSYKEGDFKESERAAQQVLSLPNYPELKESQIEEVASNIKEFFC